ncbi:helix-turn-helix transcriptional regulator [Streptomyces sp. NBC_00536]|uniref:helix-turn-helix domain-containing protein n=1 Tax=Streptomyces sp. NBC_00536 TaxID=2975769 RepID=UPI002E81227A|nr:helix-turn-helix transcriptional regulator [Streptomyces sp. NBC_00536]WUC80961.1 helix-turn-helix transcriptional regulator [Streptomyces sp. NBC_00536]
MSLETASEESVDPRERFKEELHKARELWPEGRLTQEQLARKLRISKTAVSRLERGEGAIPRGVPARLDEVFGTDGLFQRLHEAMLAQDFPARFQQRMALERTATEVWEWAPNVIPGAFQERGYAHSLIRAGMPSAPEVKIERLTSARVARREAFDRPSPPDVRLLLGESTLRLQPVAPDAMRRQLALLLRHVERATTSIRIVPWSAKPNLLMDYPISILRGAKGSQVVCVEQYRTASLLTDPDDVRNAVQAFVDLSGEARSAAESAALIRDQMERLK